MPELPEVEVLVRHLAPLLRGRRVLAVEVRRDKIIAPHSPERFTGALAGARFVGLERRGKYLLFRMKPARGGEAFCVCGHLGMTGRMYLQPPGSPLPKHAAVVLRLGRADFVFEDTRYFGRLTLDTRALGRLGPEPLGPGFTCAGLGTALRRSGQAIKVKLLDQQLVAGVGNIYASEALFRAGISPRRAARRLAPAQVQALWRAVRVVLAEAIAWGSTVPLNWTGRGRRDGLFYYGRAPDSAAYDHERLQVYDRAGQPCPRCGGLIRRITQAARSTYFCPQCQR